MNCITNKILPGRRGEGNTFVEISSPARLVVFFYFAIWRFLPEFSLFIQSFSYDPVLALLLFLVRLCSDFLLILPFSLKSISGTPIGWLHPLILPTIVSIGLDLAKNPFVLFKPLMIFLSMADVKIEHAILGNFSELESLEINIKLAILVLLGHVSYLVGYFLFYVNATPLNNSRRYLFSNTKMVALCVSCLFVFFYMISISGGFVAHFSKIAYGRARMAEDIGHLLVVVRFFPYLLAFWYLLRPEVFSKIWFWILFLIALIFTFVATGSRSGLFWPIVTLLVSWMLLNGKVPVFRFLFVAILAFLLVGILGELRISSARNDGVADFSVLSQFDLDKSITSTSKSIEESKAVSGSVAVLATVPQEVPRLHGMSYLGSLLFFVPRVIWPEKPRGAGAYVGALIYEKLESAEGYLGTSYPMSGEIEAYWNFGYYFVLIVFFFFGAFHKYITIWFMRDSSNPYRAIVFIVTLLSFDDPSSLNFSRYFQFFILIFISWFFVRKKNSISFK